MSMKRKVFGIGLNKTGTGTLGKCLKGFGYRHLSYRRDLLLALREGRIDEIFTIIDEYESFEDWPYPLMYKELFARYRDAFYILTVRSSPEVWIESLKSHSLRTHPRIHARKLAYGHDYPHGFENEHIAFYQAHNANVISFFEQNGASDLLLCACWENGDGWRELCRFLGRPMPSVPFPHVNKRTTDSSFLAENMLLSGLRLENS